MKKERSFQAKKGKNTLQRPNPKRLMDTDEVIFQLYSKRTISAYTPSLRILVLDFGKNGHAIFEVKRYTEHNVQHRAVIEERNSPA